MLSPNSNHSTDKLLYDIVRQSNFESQYLAWPNTLIFSSIDLILPKRGPSKFLFAFMTDLMLEVYMNSLLAMYVLTCFNHR